jgi:hypothetical protein
LRFEKMAGELRLIFTDLSSKADRWSC